MYDRITYNTWQPSRPYETCTVSPDSLRGALRADLAAADHARAGSAAADAGCGRLSVAAIPGSQGPGAARALIAHAMDRRGAAHPPPRARRCCVPWLAARLGGRPPEG